MVIEYTNVPKDPYEEYEGTRYTEASPEDKKKHLRSSSKRLLEEGYDVHDCLKEDYINNFGSGKLVGNWSFSLSADDKKAEKAADDQAAAKKKAEEQAAAKKKAEEQAAAKKKAEEQAAAKKKVAEPKKNSEENKSEQL